MKYLLASCVLISLSANAQTAQWLTMQHEITELRERVDSLVRISGYYHDAIYGSELFGKGLLIEEFNDHVNIHFLEKKVDSLIKALGSAQYNIFSQDRAIDSGVAEAALKLTLKEMGSTVTIDSTDQAIIHKSPDGWISVTALLDTTEKTVILHCPNKVWNVNYPPTQSDGMGFKSE